MLHQPLIAGGGISGQVSDIEIQAKEMVHTKEQLTKIYAKHTGLSLDKLTKMMDRDRYMDGKEAKSLNIVDQIVENRKK